MAIPPKTAFSRFTVKRERSPSLTLLHKLPVTVNHLAIHPDFRILLDAANHIPMDDTLILRAGLRVPRAQSQVERAADFFVEEDVVRESVDFGVRANGKLADIARAGIGIQHCQ